MKVLVLAGGFDQIALINELKSRGHYVILADYYEHPMAETAADKHCQVSTLDLERIEKLALEEKVELITTACTDQALLTVAYVSEKLGLPCYLDYETGRNVTNKEYMKAKFAEYDIPTAKNIIVDRTEGVEKAIQGMKFPLVVKPVDCNSSKGVLKVMDSETLMPALENAIQLSRTHSAVVEEYISGVEYTVDFWIDHGEPKLLAVSEVTKFKNRNTFTINGCHTLPKLEESKSLALCSIAQKIANAFSLDNMPMFMQVIDTGDSIYVLEVSARMGGGTKYRIIELYSGVPIMKIYVDRVLGMFPTISVKPTYKHILVHFIYCTKGVLKTIVGIDKLISDGVADEFYQYKTEGTYFDKAENSGDRVCGILVTGETESEVQDKLNTIYNNMQVVNENNEDMILRVE